MKLNVCQNLKALKGRNIPARGDALGLKERIEFVHAISFPQGNWLFRTKKKLLHYSKMIVFDSVRKELYSLFIEIPRTVLFCILYPGRHFGSFLPQLCSGLKYIGLSGRCLNGCFPSKG